jgi:hypothetical protein
MRNTPLDEIGFLLCEILGLVWVIGDDEVREESDEDREDSLDDENLSNVLAPYLI